jgi:hypothetical protein
MLKSILSKTYLFSALTLFLLFLLKSTPLNSQVSGHFVFDTLKIKNWPAIHSFSYAKFGNYIIMLGGRTDGVHGKQSGFENTNSNKLIFLWNTANDSIIQYPPDSLNAELKDYLNASNANFTQDDEYLYIMGGYGQFLSGVYNTYPLFLKINLKDCIEGILANKDISSSIKYLVSDQFAVAGAQMRILDSMFYLVGGHNFSGKYDSEKHTLNQKYTDALRIFKISEKNDSLHYELVKEMISDYNFHRRDYNLNPILSEKGEIKLMGFSGVFQYNANRAFLNTVLIHNQNYEEVFDFDHKFASYNCARVGLYDAMNNEMHQVFFGGMAEFYRDSANTITRDGYVPFVKSVSSVIRKKDGTLEEYLYPEELPGYFGTNSEFVINPQLKLVYQDIIDFNSLPSDTTYLGTIFGGIYNPGPLRNPWQADSAHLTKSNPYILKVYFIKNIPSSTNKPEDKNDTLNILMIPNPANNQVLLVFPKELEITSLEISIDDMKGSKIKNYKFGKLSKNELILTTSGLSPQNYFLNLLINKKHLFKKQLSIVR